jgi:hypothetical protein
MTADIRVSCEMALACMALELMEITPQTIDPNATSLNAEA